MSVGFLMNAVCVCVCVYFVLDCTDEAFVIKVQGIFVLLYTYTYICTGHMLHNVICTCTCDVVCDGYNL